MRLALAYSIILEFLVMGGQARAAAQPPPQITIFDVKLAYPMMNYQVKELVISPAQAEKLKELYGKEVFKVGEILSYYAVEPIKHRGQGFQVWGEVIDLEGKEIGVLVALHRGVIKEVSLRKGDAPKALPGIEAFLSQFKGRGMNSSFELATKPEDLLTLPPKLKPIPGPQETLKRLADLLRKGVILAGTLEL